MKGMWFDAQGYHLFVGDLDTLLVSIGVKLTGDGEAGLGCGAGDQLDDGQVADQRLGAPVHADEGKQLVLDAVPFTGAGWQMVHGNRSLSVILCAGHNQRQGGVLCQAEPKSWTAL